MPSESNIFVTEPVAGASFDCDSNINITWDSIGSAYYDCPEVDIRLYKNSDSYVTSIELNYPNSRNVQYLWSSGTAYCGNSWLIRISCSTTLRYLGYSGSFSLESERRLSEQLLNRAGGRVLLQDTNPTYQLQSYGSCKLPLATPIECEEAADSLGNGFGFAGPVSTTSSPVGCYYKPGNTIYSNTFFNQDASGTECTSVRMCVCYYYEVAYTEVRFQYFAQTSSDASWSFSPTMVPPTLKPSVSPRPTITSAPTMTSLPSSIPTERPSSPPTPVPTGNDCINMTIYMYDSHGDAWDEGAAKLYLLGEEYTFNHAVEYCQDYYFKSSGECNETSYLKDWTVCKAAADETGNGFGGLGQTTLYPSYCYNFYGSFYFNSYVGNGCGTSPDDDTSFDCVCATNTSCFTNTEHICLYPGKEVYPFTCGATYPSEISWEIKYDGTNLTAASSPAGFAPPVSGVDVADQGYCSDCLTCSDDDSITKFTVVDPFPTLFPTPEPTNQSSPTAVPTVTIVPTPAPTVTYVPTATPAPSVTFSPTTKLQASVPPTASPTSIPSPRPTTPSPTATFKPTSYDEFGGESLWTGWSNNFALTEVELPFTKGITSCDLGAMSDGTCDDGNNDMACDYDGGDCCEATCGVDDDGGDDDGCQAFDCKDPNIVDEWPFITTNQEITYPFTTQKAFLSILKAKNKTATFEDLPSLSCPDCNAYNNSGTSYLSIPFEVETNLNRAISRTTTFANTSREFVNQSTGEVTYGTTSTTLVSYEKYYEMFPVLNGTRERDFLSKNRVIGGVLLTQTRANLGSCSSLPTVLKKNFKGDCANDDQPLYAQYGVDPTFVSTSSLYRETNKPLQYYSADELNEASALPYGFFYDGGCVDCDGRFPVKDFPILFDVNFNVSHASTYLTMLLDGNYIDSYTSTLLVRIPMLSYELGRYLLISVSFVPVEVGNWNLEYQIDVLSAKINNWEWENGLDIWQSVVEVAFLVSWMVLVMIEASEARKSVKLTGYVFKYLLDLGNCLDWLNYGLQLGAVVCWTVYVVQTDRLAHSLKLHYDVYSNYMAVARLTEVTEDMGKFQALVANIEQLVDLRRDYSNFLCFSLLVTCLQTLKNLDFHPKMGLITKTISGAASDLVFFVILYLIVQVVYGFLAVLVFGKFASAFSSFGSAFVTNQYLLLGIYEPQDDMDMAPQQMIATIYYWSYMLITFFILLNALLAIIVESYAGVKSLADQEEDIDPLSKVLTMYLHNLTRHKVDAAISNKDLKRALLDLFNNTYAQKVS